MDTDLLELGRDDFRDLIARFPKVLENLTAILTRRLAEATSRQARGGRRGEAVALVGGRPEDTQAATAASPGSVAVLDGDASLGDALDQLDARLRDNRTVILTYALDGDDLPQLLRHVDRTVAVVASQEDADRLAAVAERHGVRGQPIEVVLGDGVEPPPGDALEVVHRGVDDAAWIGRHLARTKLGLALGAAAPRATRWSARCTRSRRRLPRGLRQRQQHRRDRGHVDRARHGRAEIDAEMRSTSRRRWWRRRSRSR